MHNRLVSAALRLFFPASAYQSLDNPIQVDRLPAEYADARFDYPVYQSSPLAARRSAAMLVFVTAIGAPLMMWANRLIYFPWVHGGLQTIVLLAAGVLLVVGIVGNRRPLTAIVLAVLSVPILAQLVAEIPFPLAALLPAMLGAIFCADRLATFYVHLKSAAPTPPPWSAEARALWSRRFQSLLRPLRGVELYPFGFLLFGFPAWLVMRRLATTASGDEQKIRILVEFGFLLVAGLAWPLAWELLIAPLYGRAPYGPRRLISAFVSAVSEWCTYNRLNTPGVGVHRSPAGSCRLRRCLLIGVLLLWACVWAGTTPPVSLIDYLFSPAVEQKIVAEMTQQQIDRFSKGVADEIRKDFEPPLDDDEQRMLQRMSPDAAQEYRRDRTRLHEESVAAAQRRRRDEKANTESAHLVLRLFRKLLSIAFNVLVPTLGTCLVCLVLVFSASARSLAGAEDLFGSAPRQRILSSENWESLVERLRLWGDDCERNSLFLGTNARDDTPVLVPREVFQEHAHILGDSGSGKTSLGLMPLVSQLMRYGDCSVVVIDLKADDQAMFETLRIESQALDQASRKEKPDGGGYPFRWFTTALDRSSYVFNPLTQRVMPKLADYQRTDVITAALGLQYGTDYGRKYYGDANYDLLNYAVQQYPQVQSFTELADILQNADRFPLPKETKKAATHVRSSVSRLARCEPLNGSATLRTPRAALDQAIDFADLFARPQALYFALPPSSGISNTAEIARISVYSLLAAAQMHDGKRTQVYLVIDEFQRVVSNNLATLLQTARSMNIGVILANQSLEDLDFVDTNLIPAVRTNTRFRQVFAAGNRLDLQDLQATAGEAVIGLRSWNLLPSLLLEPPVHSMTVRETPVPRLSLNDILLATDAFGRNITFIRRGQGYAQYGGMPFIMDSVHHIPFKTFEERRDEDWPAAREGTVISEIRETKLSPPPGGARILDDPTAPPSLPEADDDDSDEDSLLPGSSEGIGGVITEVYDAQRARHEERRKRRRRAQENHLQGPSDDLFPGYPIR